MASRPTRTRRALRPLDAFTRAFFQAALWSTAAHATNDERDDSSFEDLGYTSDDIDPYVRNALAEECESFQEEFGDAIANSEVSRGQGRRGRYSTLEQAGHDFWLTRNRHGVGFRDGDWPAPLDELLDQASKRMGEVDLYVAGQNRNGRNGTIYASGYEKPR